MTQTLQVGAPAPAFELPAAGGKTARLADFAGRKLVLYFYPKDDTTACTKEAMEFNGRLGDFAAAGTAVLGVSADSVASHDKFRRKHKLGLDLGSDESTAMLQAYGVWGKKSMYGRSFMGIVRTTVLIDAAGRVARVWTKVRVAGHVDDVLATARAL